MNEEELWLDHVRMMRLVKSVIETNCEDIYIIDTYIADLKNRINWDKEAIKAVNARRGVDMVDDYSVAIKALYIHRANFQIIVYKDKVDFAKRSQVIPDNESFYGHIEVMKRYKDVQNIRDMMAKRLGDRVILRK
jgi:hypothetical protein